MFYPQQKDEKDEEDDKDSSKVCIRSQIKRMEEKKDIIIKKKAKKIKVEKEVLKPKKGYQKMRKKRNEVMHSQGDLELKDDGDILF